MLYALPSVASAQITAKTMMSSQLTALRAVLATSRL